MCNILEEKCPECKGTGKNIKVTFIGEPPNCSFCEGTGCIPRGMILRWE